MKLNCGHTADCDLDTICPKCGRSFMRRPYIPYLLISLSLLIIYYLRPINFEDLLLPVFGIGVWLIIIFILRNRPNELTKALMILIPTMIITSFIDKNAPIYLVDFEKALIIISIVVISIPVVSSINLGFQDAMYLNKLNKGSFWIVLSMFISLGLTILYYTLPIIIELAEIELIKNVLNEIYYYLEIIYKYRSAIVAVILGLVTIVSISASLIKELKVKPFTFPNSKKSTGTSPIDIILTSMENVFKIIGGGIMTAGNLVRQILVIIFEQVFALIRDTIIRTFLILLRLIRTTILVILSVFIYRIIHNIVLFSGELWSSGNLWTSSINGWISFTLNCALLPIVLWLLTMLSYRKWKEFNSSPFSINRTLSSFFGSKTEVLVAYRSLTISIIMNLFFFSLSFLATWLVINPVHYLFYLNYPEPLGFLFILSVSTILIFGIIKLLSTND